MLRRALLTAAMLASVAAFGQEADEGSVPALCGQSLTDEGACYGEVAAFCEAPNEGGSTPEASVRSVDCGALELEGMDLQGRCLKLPGLPATCGVARSLPCAMLSGGGVVQLACLSGNTLDPNGACDLDRGCVEGPPCGAAEPSCAGDVLRLGCAPFGQALVIDCASFGGRCEAGACVDVEEGNSCGDVLDCREGLVCVGNEGGLGSCVREGALVSPVDPPAEEPPPPPASCAGIPPEGRGGLVWLGLVAFLFARFHGFFREIARGPAK